MEALALEFERRVQESIRDSIAHGDRPTRVIQMVQDHGAVGAAKRLVIKGEIQKGMRNAAAAGRRNMTLEAIMVEPQFADLFTAEELASARWRLTQV